MRIAIFRRKLRLPAIWVQSPESALLIVPSLEKIHGLKKSFSLEKLSFENAE
jgi:hypothetical protein